MKAVVVPISKEPKYIIVTDFGNGEPVHHYHVDNLNTVNKNCDIGVWKEKI